MARKTTMNLQGELGHRFGNRWAVFVDAAAGVMGRESFLGLDWSVQAGVTPRFTIEIRERT